MTLKGVRWCVFEEHYMDVVNGDNTKDEVLNHSVCTSLNGNCIDSMSINYSLESLCLVLYILQI